MTRKTWVLVIASVLVSSILLEGQVFAAGERKKIVMVSNSTAFVLLRVPTNDIADIEPILPRLFVRWSSKWWSIVSKGDGRSKHDRAIERRSEATIGST